MRNLLLSVTLAFIALGAVGQSSSTSKISQLPDGVLSGSIYSNDVLGLSFEFPSGWTVKADPKDPVRLDDRKLDEKANVCSHILLSLWAPHRVEGRFPSTATLFVIDPECFPGTEFPRSLEEKDKIRKIADKIIKPYSHTPYFSPYRVTIGAYSSQGRVIILLTGGLIINAVEGRHPATKEPLKMNTLFSFMESRGYWVAWAYLADDPSAEELKNVKLEIKDAAPQ